MFVLVTNVPFCGLILKGHYYSGNKDKNIKTAETSIENAIYFWTVITYICSGFLSLHTQIYCFAANCSAY